MKKTDFSKCPKCGQPIYIIVGDPKGGWYHCYEANPDLSEGEEVEIKAGSRLDRADEVEDVVHYTCEIGLAGLSSNACNKVYCTSKEELIALFETSNTDEVSSTKKNGVVEERKILKGKRQPNPEFMDKLTPSKELAAIIGDEPLTKTEAVAKIWSYVNGQKLRDINNNRMINTDAKLKTLFNGKEQVEMSEMTKLISQHLSEPQ